MVASKNQLRQAESLLQAGNIDAAGSSYEEILNGDSGCAEAVIGLSIIANKKGDSSRAIKLAQEAINLCPGNVGCLEFLANLHIQADQQEAALKIHLDILGRDPASIRSLCIAAGIYDSFCEFETAAEFYLRALELDPQNSSALIGLGFTRQRQGLAADGGNCFRKAINLGNKSKFAFSGLAYSLLQNGDLDGALRNFREAEQAFLTQINLPDPATKIKISFLIHEKEQLEYLDEKNLLPISYRGYLDNLKSIVEKYMHLRGAGNNIDITCSEEEIENIAPLFNKVVYRGNGDQIEGCVISPNLDVNEIERAYNQSVPEITYVDGLLTQEALNRLYTYCVESTIFKKAYGAGYVGSTLAEGFASPLLLQISEDLRRCFPKIFGQHRLMQARGVQV